MSTGPDSVVAEPDTAIDDPPTGDAASTPVDSRHPSSQPAPVGKGPFASEPYAFEQCTLTVTLQFWPAAGEPPERLVLVSARNHLDVPLMAAVPAGALGALPPVVTALLERLRSELPERERAHAAREANRAPQPGAPSAGRKGKPAGTPAPAAPQPPRPRPPIQTPAVSSSHEQLDLFAPKEGETK